MSKRQDNADFVGRQVGTINPVVAGGMGTGQGEVRGEYYDLIQTRSPDWTAHHSLWHKYWLSYKGGQAFVDEYMVQYKREEASDFTRRKRLGFNPAHAKGVINTIRNSLAVKLPDVKREGSEQYLSLMGQDVDAKKHSMAAFVAECILPPLLATGAIGVWLDSPKKTDDETQMDDRYKLPFMFTVMRGDILSLGYDENTMELQAVLLREYVENKNKHGLSNASVVRYRYAVIRDGRVHVLLIDKLGVRIDEIELALTRIPFVLLQITEPLMADIADMQIALMNLNSIDVSFLVAANFPVWTRQVDPKMERQLQFAQTAHSGSEDDVEDAVDEARTGTKRMGITTGVTYPIGANQPNWVAPPSNAVEISMKKQDKIAQEIRILTDIALTSLSVEALRQSGASKEADRVGHEAALAYLASVLETGDRSIAMIMGEMMGDNVDSMAVNYPRNFNVKTDRENRTEAKEIIEIRDAVPIPSFVRAANEMIIEAVMRGREDEDTIKQALEEVWETAYWDSDPQRVQALQMLLANKIVSKETGATLVGLAPEEAQKAQAESDLDLDKMLGGVMNQAPVGVNTNEEVVVGASAGQQD